jgi:hypothetical protein
MSQKLSAAIAVIGIDIGKNSFHIVGHDQRGAIVLRQKWSRGQVETRLANLPPCLIGMEACVGAHHLSRKLQMLGHDARLMPAKYVRPYSKGQKNDSRGMSTCRTRRRRGHRTDGMPPSAGVTNRTGRPRSNSRPLPASKLRTSTATFGRLPPSTTRSTPPPSLPFFFCWRWTSFAIAIASSSF